MIQELKTTTTLVLMLFLMVTACTEGEEPGPLATEERVVSAFNAIDVETIGKVNLHVAPEFRVVIRTNVNVLDDIVLSIYDEELNIRLTGKHKDIDLLQFDVYAPEYSRIRLDGVADIRSDELLTSENMFIEQDGVGNIFLADVEAENISFNLDEVGNVEVSGFAENVTAVHSGVGNLKLFGLSGKDGDLKLSGTGNIDINVSDALKINLSGVGDIRYMGNPAMNVNHTGVGKIIHVN